MNNLKYYRKKEKLTQEELGKLVGVTGRAIGYYEKGKREPKLTIAKKLADLFNTSIEELFEL